MASPTIDSRAFYTVIYSSRGDESSSPVARPRQVSITHSEEYRSAFLSVVPLSTGWEIQTTHRLYRHIRDPHGHARQEDDTTIAFWQEKRMSFSGDTDGTICTAQSEWTRHGPCFVIGRDGMLETPHPGPEFFRVELFPREHGLAATNVWVKVLPEVCFRLYVNETEFVVVDISRQWTRRRR